MSPMRKCGGQGGLSIELKNTINHLKMSPMRKCGGQGGLSIELKNTINHPQLVEELGRKKPNSLAPTQPSFSHLHLSVSASPLLPCSSPATTDPPRPSDHSRVCDQANTCNHAQRPLAAQMTKLNGHSRLRRPGSTTTRGSGD